MEGGSDLVHLKNNFTICNVFRYVQKFTEEQVKTDKFVVTVHAVTQRRSRLRSLKWATEFYKLLKNR